MTTSVLAAGMFSLLCWILPQPNGRPVMQLPPQDPKGSSPSSGWTTKSDESSSEDEAQPSNEQKAEREDEAEPDQHSGSEGAGPSSGPEGPESDSDSLGGRTLVLGEPR